MATSNSMLIEVEKTIKKLNPNEQRKLLLRLPKLLRIKPEDLELLKLTEQSFKFWNNDEDSIYDTL